MTTSFLHYMYLLKRFIVSFNVWSLIVLLHPVRLWLSVARGISTMSVSRVLCVIQHHIISICVWLVVGYISFSIVPPISSNWGPWVMVKRPWIISRKHSAPITSIIRSLMHIVWWQMIVSGYSGLGVFPIHILASVWIQIFSGIFLHMWFVKLMTVVLFACIFAISFPSAT